MRIFLTRANSERDQNVYVDRDDRKRTLTAKVTDARSNYGIEEIAAKYPSLTVTVQGNETIAPDVDKSAYTVSIELKISDDLGQAKEQMSTFASLLSKLNNENFNSYFYLNRTDFFNRQCKNMVDSLFGKVSRESFNQSSYCDRGHDHSAAF